MQTIPPHEQLGRMITGYWISQAIYAAAKFGIADLLKEGPKSVDELAAATNTEPDLLYRLLRALASVGIFSEQPDRQFKLTPLAELLRSDIPMSQRSLALMMGGDQYRAWGNLADTVQTGDNAYEKLFGKPIFERLSEQPEMARVFDDAMTGIHGRETQAMLDAYDFAGINVIADIGGGNGSTILAILEKHTHLKGILFDLPHVVERTRKNIESAGMLDRCQLIGGDFFETIPTNADAYLMRHIIHDWDDQKSLQILQNCHRVMSPGSKLLLVESVIPPGNEPFTSKLLDLTMMLIPGGKERTEEEYRELYDQAGYELTRIVPTRTEVSVIEGIR